VGAHSLVGERPIGSDARRTATERRPGSRGSGRVWRRPRVRPARRLPRRARRRQRRRSARSRKIARAHRLSAAYNELQGGDARVATAAEADFAFGPPCASFAEVRGQSRHGPSAVGAAAPQAAADPHKRMRRHRQRRSRGRHPRRYGGHRVRVGRQRRDDRHRLPAIDPGVRAEQRHSAARSLAARTQRALAQRAPAVQPQTRVRSPASSSRPSATAAGLFSDHLAPLRPAAEDGGVVLAPSVEGVL
jgi:hypothetical protein